MLDTATNFSVTSTIFKHEISWTESIEYVVVLASDNIPSDFLQYHPIYCCKRSPKRPPGNKRPAPLTSSIDAESMEQPSGGDYMKYRNLLNFLKTRFLVLLGVAVVINYPKFPFSSHAKCSILRRLFIRLDRYDIWILIDLVMNSCFFKPIWNIADSNKRKQQKKQLCFVG